MPRKEECRPIKAQTFLFNNKGLIGPRQMSANDMYDDKFDPSKNPLGLTEFHARKPIMSVASHQDYFSVGTESIHKKKKNGFLLASAGL